MIEVYTDAASKGNPGPSAIGFFIKTQKQKFHESSYIGVYSNHEAEFIAVIKSLKYCQNHFSNEIISIRSDSKVVVDTVDKNHTKNKQFVPYLNEIKLISQTFPYVFIKWIPEKQNYQADQLARVALLNHEKHLR
jgi:ribonuclease HI